MWKCFIFDTKKSVLCYSGGKGRALTWRYTWLNIHEVLFEHPVNVSLLLPRFIPIPRAAIFTVAPRLLHPGFGRRTELPCHVLVMICVHQHRAPRWNWACFWVLSAVTEVISCLTERKEFNPPAKKTAHYPRFSLWINLYVASEKMNVFSDDIGLWFVNRKLFVGPHKTLQVRFKEIQHTHNSP